MNRVAGAEQAEEKRGTVMVRMSKNRKATEPSRAELHRKRVVYWRNAVEESSIAVARS